MKKSLVCAVLAGLLAGCVMTGVEAADPIDVVIKADGSVTPNTYTSMTYVGVSTDSGTIDFGSNIKTIRTDGKLNTKLYTTSPVGTPVFGIGAGPDIKVRGGSISEINISADGLCCGIYNNNMSKSGNVQLTNLGKIIVNGDSSAYGIYMGYGINEIGFAGDSSVEVSGGSGNDISDIVVGINILGGTTTITGLKNIIVDDGDGIAIQVSSSGMLRIGGENSTNLLAVNGDILCGGILNLKNASVSGCIDATWTSSMKFDQKVTVNGGIIINNEIVADDAGDDFTFGKVDGSIFNYADILEGMNISNVEAKVKIFANEINLHENIINKGQLTINPNAVPGFYRIYGDVYHNAGAKTEINLVGKMNNMGDDIFMESMLSGNVYGSDSNFRMRLDRAGWAMINYVDDTPVLFDHVYNVTLKNGAFISLNRNNGCSGDRQIYSPAYDWKDIYGKVTFHNLQNDGTGCVYLAVDLANNVGDQIILQGETPEKLDVMLVNKDNNDGEEFVPDGEHKVTYAITPKNKEVNIETSLTPMYGKQSMLYTPIVETEDISENKHWNFVGWSQRPRDSKENVRATEELPQVLPDMEDKRLEEIHRYAVHKDFSELGAWVRGETGRMSAEGVDFDVKVISGGYDWANKTSKGNFFMGLGVSHGTSEADMGFVGNSKNTSFSIYSSWYGRKNYDYIDFVAKYGKIDHQYGGTNFDGIDCAGEYDKKMYSFLTKYGRRLPMKNGYYFEPFGSFTYGHINSADFIDKAQGAHMYVDSILSEIASVGVMFGRSVKGTEMYCKLAYSYDFDGEVRGSVPEQNYNEKTDMGGSSYKFAVGVSRNLGKQNSLHLDLEKDFGGKMEKPWNFALTFKHTW